MAKEIERKFLVLDQSYRQHAKGVYYQQGYISFNPAVRVRTADQQAFLTIMGPRHGLSRAEYEYPIPYDDALEMLQDFCIKPIIEKYRYKVEYGGFTWEIDEFLKDNEGLVVAEIELDDEQQEFPLPPFIGKEVTDDKRFRNTSLVKNPYKNWPKRT